MSLVAQVLGKLGVLLSFMSLAHAAFSAAQYRGFLRVSEQPFEGQLPVDIVAQTIVSLLVLLYSIVSVTGELKVIKADLSFGSKHHDQVFGPHPPSFWTFNHRGIILK